jgi:hypothetical protein
VAGHRELQVHTSRSTKPLEWVGLTIVKSWLQAEAPDLVIDDVHNDRDWFDKGIDLVLKYPDHTESVDLKVDSYYGTDESKKTRGFYNRDSGALILETTSQLRYDRTDLERHPDVPGWFFTSQADQIYYYFIAILTPPLILKDILARRRVLDGAGGGADVIDHELLSKLEVERDLLVSYPLKGARAWFKSAPEEAFEGWAGAGNPRYVTVSKRLKRDYLLQSGLGVSHGPIFQKARKSIVGI